LTRISEEDAFLMALVAGADPDARHALARRLHVRVRKIARALLRNAADADDATQTCLMEILKAAGGYRGESTIERWADRIAVRVTMRLARERRMWSVRVEAAAEPDAVPAPEPEESVAPSMPRHIEAYLAELPEARRTALVLRHAMGYSVDEIARLTEASPNTVKDRLLQAREQVRRMVRRDAVVFNKVKS
jgi:RNA polymerase sigma-70 factor (ECF subfamily)